MKLWWSIVGFVSGYGLVGGLTSGAPAGDYLYFVGAMLVVGLIGTGAINAYRKKQSP